MGFSTRMYESIAQGCVPLVIQDEPVSNTSVDQAFEELLPYPLFSLRLTQAHTPNLDPNPDPNPSPYPNPNPNQERGLVPLEAESASPDFLQQLRDFSDTFRLSEESQLAFVKAHLGT